MSSLTAYLKLVMQTTGENEDTWGDIANDNWEFIEEKLCKHEAFALTGGNKTLTDQEERSGVFTITGTLASNQTITFTGREGFWIVENNTSGAFTLKAILAGPTTGATLTQGQASIIYCDGTDMELVNLGAGSSTASGVTFTPTGSIAATNVQTAIAELDSETTTALGNKQPLDATLTAIAALTVAADKYFYATGADAFSVADLTAFARTILDDADAAAVRTTISAQPLDATLTALAGVTVAADQVIYATGADAFSATGLTSFGRSLIDDANAAAGRTTLELQDLATLDTVGTSQIDDGAVTNAKAADMAQSTIKGRAAGAGTGDPTDLTATQATAILNVFVGDTGSGGVKGLAPATVAGDATKFLRGDGTWQAVAAGGTVDAADVTFTPASNIAATDVQAAIEEVNAERQPLDATLTALAGVTSAADRVPYFTGADAASVATFTAFGRSLVDDADAAAGRTTLELQDLATLDTVGTSQIDNDAVTNAKLANMAAGTYKMRVTASTGDPEDATAAQATAGLNAVVGDSGSGGTKGLVPAPAAGDAAANKYLKADGTWATASTSIADNDVTNAKLRDSAATSVIGRSANSTGDPADIAASASDEVLRRSGTTLGFGTLATGSLDNDAVTNAKLANMAAGTYKMRVTASTGDPEDATAAQATAGLNAVVGDSGSGGTKGLVPAPGSGDAAAGKFLKADATWAVPAGGGTGLLPVDIMTFSDDQTFNSSGTWTKPGSGTYAFIEVWGGGGGGGRCVSGTGGGGGGGGGYKYIYKLMSDLGATVTVTIGAGGTGSSSANTNGTAGGNTTFGAHVTGYGGGGGNGTATSAQSAGGGGGGGWTGAGGVGAADDTQNQNGGAGAGGRGGHQTSSAGVDPRGDNSFYGGGGGGLGETGTDKGAPGGWSIYGGGGGGGGATATSTAGGAGGTSIYGGDGGAGQTGDLTGTAGAGTQPGGGGGGTELGTAGAGAAGRVRVRVW